MCVQLCKYPCTLTSPALLRGFLISLLWPYFQNPFFHNWIPDLYSNCWSFSVCPRHWSGNWNIFFLNHMPYPFGKESRTTIFKDSHHCPQGARIRVCSLVWNNHLPPRLCDTCISTTKSPWILWASSHPQKIHHLHRSLKSWTPLQL